MEQVGEGSRCDVRQKSVIKSERKAVDDCERSHVVGLETLRQRDEDGLDQE